MQIAPLVIFVVVAVVVLILLGMFFRYVPIGLLINANAA
jgi:uncharacterized protein YqfA (UPF0365 family)